MKSSYVYGMALLGLAMLGTGCASNQSIVRGQSPAAGNQGIQQTGGAYMAASMDHGSDVSLYHQSSVGGPQYGGEYGGGYGDGSCPTCPPGGAYGNGCPPGGPDGMICRTPWHPTHHHSYSYEQPNNLRYPSNQPGSIVRYPYYTMKGPDDFFRK
ncbi:hypothetical protein Pla110_35490 [Polystyrenella longa]|uniref:Lipoprotein n=1 Tax=Polystyrenella longa TaxID=2528007 RepID=A0A518CRE7_9PLAN|nr:hypothetical protein [Polystyrenella longa]QDU81799.1 hypothetical protein Pla110_35490 [Polystyrenella longa]